MRILACYAVAVALWLPSMHCVFRTSRRAVAEPLAAELLAAWKHPDGTTLRATNPEWDLMARMFAVLAFANLALAPENERVAGRYVAAIDRIISDTERLEASHGHRYFLLPYGQHGAFRDRAGRSLFVDGELALMQGVRELVAPGSAGTAKRLRERLARIAAQLERSPRLIGESYPDEVWVFCNAVALAALRVGDEALGSDHDALVQRWVASARAHLIDPRTGLLVAKTTYAGEALDGPEGSTIWLVADMLRVVDADFAADQYRRARAELAGDALGFAWSREWPASWPGVDDVDSGPTVPIVGANAGASGLALVAATSFGDDELVAELLASLELAAFPIATDDGLRYAAGNRLSDAVILYALVSGPLWRRVA
jgi:hypothetical protein